MNCTDSYIGETARRLSERVMDHAGRDTKLSIARHCLNSNHEIICKAIPSIPQYARQFCSFAAF